MKITTKNLVNALFILLLGVILFTPIGFYMKVQVNRLLAFSPSTLDTDHVLQMRSYDWYLVDTEGNRTNFKEVKGKIVLVSFWATWCPPCVAELPSFQKLYNKYGEEVKFVFLANDKKEKVNQFLDKKGYTIPVYYSGSETPEVLEHGSIPTTYIIDKNGKIVVKEVGAADWASEKVFALLDQLIKQ